MLDVLQRKAVGTAANRVPESSSQSRHRSIRHRLNDGADHHRNDKPYECHTRRDWREGMSSKFLLHKHLSQSQDYKKCESAELIRTRAS